MSALRPGPRTTLALCIVSSLVPSPSYHCNVQLFEPDNQTFTRYFHFSLGELNAPDLEKHVEVGVIRLLPSLGVMAFVVASTAVVTSLITKGERRCVDM